VHLLICALLCVLLYVLGVSAALAHTTTRMPDRHAVVRATAPTLSVPTLDTSGLVTSAPTPIPTATSATQTAAASAPPAPLAPAIDFAMRDFQTGVAFPRWSSGGYSGADAGWQVGLNEIQQQTSAGWVEMMIQLYQDYQSSTSVHTGAATPAPQSLAAGIRTAHSMGLHVFIVPLLGVLHGQPWGGAIHFASYAQTRTWFASYWHALQSYMAAAADAGAEQFAIGTELSALESADSGLWYDLLASAQATFRGDLTYDVNWSTLGAEPRGWMRDSRLSYLGVSEYAPLASGMWRLSAEQIGAVWQQRFLPSLEALSSAAGKPVLLSEIGYRNARDALYRPWDHSSRARADPELQASAYNQALRAVYDAPSIAGIFFWAWSVDQFAPNGLPAARVLRTYYDYYQALARRAALHRRNKLARLDGLLP